MEAQYAIEVTDARSNTFGETSLSAKTRRQTSAFLLDDNLQSMTIWNPCESSTKTNNAEGGLWPYTLSAFASTPSEVPRMAR